jgi:hypothetical protein
MVDPQNQQLPTVDYALVLLVLASHRFWWSLAQKAPYSPRREEIIMQNAKGPWLKDYCKVCGEINCTASHLRFEKTQAGMQAVIAETPGRTVPTGPLKPKRAQTEKPTLLEAFHEEVKQGKLF